jgi:hypothetical protein
MVELEGRAEEVLFNPADTSTDVALRAVAVEFAEEETTDEVLFAFNEASVDVPLRAVDVELDDEVAAGAVLLPPLLAAADLVPLPEGLVPSLADEKEAAFVVALLALAAVAPVALEAAALPEVAPWDTTTQLPKFPAVLNETRHLFPDAPPAHLVPAGSWTESCCDPVAFGAASPFTRTVAAAKDFPVPEASTCAVT